MYTIDPGGGTPGPTNYETNNPKLTMRFNCHAAASGSQHREYAIHWNEAELVLALDHLATNAVADNHLVATLEIGRDA